jgi:SAM-dependent methyltransferase
MSSLPRPARVIPIRPKHAPKPAPVHPFDRLHGTVTSGLIPRSGLLTGHPSDAHVTAYYGVAPSILLSLLDFWLGTHPPLPIERYTFLDVGAGKGRSTLVAAQSPFVKVCGVELNPALAAIARANVAVFAQSPEANQLAPIEIVEGDALEVPFPAGPLVAFLFHPFEAPLVRRFLARIAEHCAASSLDILYVNAEHAHVFDRNSAFKQAFYGMVPMSAEDHLADMAEIAGQTEYGSTGDELCAIYRLKTT